MRLPLAEAAGRWRAGRVALLPSQQATAIAARHFGLHRLRQRLEAAGWCVHRSLTQEVWQSFASFHAALTAAAGGAGGAAMIAVLAGWA